MVKDENGEEVKVQGPLVYPGFQGNCGLCGKPVIHFYPWWSGNPEDPESQPFHDECFWEWSK